MTDELCSNSVTAADVPNQVIASDGVAELFNFSSESLDLLLYRLYVNTAYLWLELTIQPLGYKVWYRQQDGLGFVEGGANTLRLYRTGESPAGACGYFGYLELNP